MNCSDNAFGRTNPATKTCKTVSWCRQVYSGAAKTCKFSHADVFRPCTFYNWWFEGMRDFLFRIRIRDAFSLLENVSTADCMKRRCLDSGAKQTRMYQGGITVYDDWSVPNARITNTINVGKSGVAKNRTSVRNLSLLSDVVVSGSPMCIDFTWRKEALTTTLRCECVATENALRTV